VNDKSEKTLANDGTSSKGVTAETFDELLPFIKLCKAGHLDEVQSWINAGKPINPPPPIKGRRRKGPLHKAIDAGFYSIIEVLLKAGTVMADSRPFALERALANRRLDIVKLLIQYGANIKAVEMDLVFETWQPEIIDYFFEHGADVETGNPLAAALCERIKTALGAFKRHKDRFPQLQSQIDIALRFHCREGDKKWAGLMLWAGANPYSKGPDSPYESPDPDGDISALEYAAIWNRPEIFELKQIKITPDIPVADELFEAVCRSENADLLLKMLDSGFDPTKRSDQGSGLINACFSGMDWPDWHNWFDRDRKIDLDTDHSREKIKMIYALAKHGAKWIPTDNWEINDIRRTLLKMKDDYTVEFIWIMSKFKSCKRDNAVQLLRTPAIQKLVSAHKTRMEEIINDFPE